MARHSHAHAVRGKGARGKGIRAFAGVRLTLFLY